MNKNVTLLEEYKSTILSCKNSHLPSIKMCTVSTGKVLVCFLLFSSIQL